MACAAPICAAISTSSCSAGTAAATPQRPSTPCSASARASDPPTTATSSDNAADPGRPGASHRPPSDPPQSGPGAGPPACLTALETNFPKSKSSRTSPGTVQEPCLERRRPINIWCDRKQREKPFELLRRVCPLGGTFSCCSEDPLSVRMLDNATLPRMSAIRQRCFSLRSKNCLLNGNSEYQLRPVLCELVRRAAKGQSANVHQDFIAPKTP